MIVRFISSLGLTFVLTLGASGRVDAETGRTATAPRVAAIERFDVRPLAPGWRLELALGAPRAASTDFDAQGRLTIDLPFVRPGAGIATRLYPEGLVEEVGVASVGLPSRPVTRLTIGTRGAIEWRLSADGPRLRLDLVAKGLPLPPLAAPIAPPAVSPAAPASANPAVTVPLPAAAPTPAPAVPLPAVAIPPPAPTVEPSTTAERIESEELDEAPATPPGVASVATPAEDGDDEPFLTGMPAPSAPAAAETPTPVAPVPSVEPTPELASPPGESIAGSTQPPEIPTSPTEGAPEAPLAAVEPPESAPSPAAEAREELTPSTLEPESTSEAVPETASEITPPPPPSESEPLAGIAPEPVPAAESPMPVEPTPPEGAAPIVEESDLSEPAAAPEPQAEATVEPVATPSPAPSSPPIEAPGSGPEVEARLAAAPTVPPAEEEVAESELLVPDEPLAPAEESAASPSPAVPEAAPTTGTPAEPGVEPLPELASPAPDAKPTLEPALPPLAEPAAPIDSPAEVSPPENFAPASSVVGIQPLGEGLVRVVGDGQLRFSAFRLENPERFVIDVHGVVNRSELGTLEIGEPLVRRIRVSQFRVQPELVTRVIFDLTAPAIPDIASGPHSLTVRFGKPIPLAPGGPRP